MESIINESSMNTWNNLTPAWEFHLYLDKFKQLPGNFSLNCSLQEISTLSSSVFMLQ